MSFSNSLQLLNCRNFKRFRVKAYSPGVPTVFMHIPKTSGTALTLGLVDAIAPRNALCYGMGKVLFGSFEDFRSMGNDVRSRLYLDPRSLPEDADFVSGHMAFSTLLEKYANAQYITILREPMSRTLSHWLFWRSHSDDQLTSWGRWAQRVNQSRGSLHDFLSCRDLACQLDNLYVRMLLWPHRLIPEDDFIEERTRRILIYEAIGRLKQFAYVDLVENPKLDVNIQRWLRRPFIYKLANETSRLPEPLRTPLHKELTPETFNLLQRRTRLDLELWFAVGRQCIAELSLESLYLRTVLENATRLSSLIAPAVQP